MGQQRRSVDTSKIGALRAQIMRSEEAEQRQSTTHRRAASLIETRKSRPQPATQMVQDEVSHHWRAADDLKAEEKLVKPAPRSPEHENHQDIPLRTNSRKSGFSIRSLFRARSRDGSRSVSPRHQDDDSSGKYSNAGGSQSPRDQSPARPNPSYPTPASPPSSYSSTSSYSSYPSSSSSSSSYSLVRPSPSVAADQRSSTSTSFHSSTSPSSYQTEVARRESLLAHASALLRNQSKPHTSQGEVSRAEQSVAELRSEVAREKELLRQLRNSD